MWDELLRLCTADSAALRFIGDKFYMMTIGAFPHRVIYLLLGPYS